MSCLLLALTNLCGLVIITILWATQAFCVPWVQQSGGHALGAEWSIAQASILPTDAWGLLINLGICNLMYNMASQIVLAHVSVVSHGMLELFKRVFVLLTASVLLGDVDWKLHNALGASIATLGTVLYFTSEPSHAVNSISTSTKHNPSSQKVVGILVTPAASPSSVTKRLGSSAGQSKEKDRSSNNLQGQAGPAVNAYTAAAEAVPRTLVGSEHLRLHCAYGIMFLVLIFSPIEFLEGAGVSTLSPKWFTAVSTSSSTATAVAESWSTWIRQPNSNDNMPTSKGTIPTIGTAKTDSVSLVNGGISSSPGVNQPVPINDSERLIVPAPNATMYNPMDSTSEVLVGGISKLKGLLPYHKNLRRASALTASCKHLQTLPKQCWPSGPNYSQTAPSVS
ncbi:hypothetical protein CEUSTIGMA_g13693.t1 [Chlamydomonas eustigma]|uniref:Sugar phosphate transporter domain-containing protein n=1 Tax=Chlamydomonas eustigma TaxID=1157962 RepID=A0A250XT57_9CHLO|nr:hypothetical protein CEUSTIGMA_g13693.t1 [Chlamydomonas eustigma]|eukprot:GAX86281.1 hypothetical protein CEUSTIGMA_g13693.t1 [Chlamydomonas eustigma]